MHACIYIHTYIRTYIAGRQGPTDVKDLLTNLSRAGPDDDDRQGVAERAMTFAHAHLNQHARDCYWRALLELYARRLAQPPAEALATLWPTAVWAEDFHRPRRPSLGAAGGTGSAAGTKSKSGASSPSRRRNVKMSDAAALRAVVDDVERRIQAHRLTKSMWFEHGLERRSK